MDFKAGNDYHRNTKRPTNSGRVIVLGVFIENEKERWQCVKCGGVVCVHRVYCYNCGEIAN